MPEHSIPSINYACRLDHQGRLVFDRVAAQVGARLAAQDEIGRRDHGALFVHAGRQHGLVARHGRRQRILQAGVLAVPCAAPGAQIRSVRVARAPGGERVRSPCGVDVATAAAARTLASRNARCGALDALRRTRPAESPAAVPSFVAAATGVAPP
jgi:hypothetical protein